MVRQEGGPGPRPPRVLCLGNDLLADDALGPLVAARLREADLEAEIVDSPEAGLNLLDAMVGASRLIVVDTVLTGAAPPGAIHLLREDDISPAAGGSPHYLGLAEALALGRRLGLELPDDVLIVAVEAADCTTVGGPMTPPVKAAVPAVVDCVRRLLSSTRPD